MEKIIFAFKNKKLERILVIIYCLNKFYRNSLMSRGTKLDIFIGADIKEGWTKVEDAHQSPQKTLEPSKHSLHFAKEKRNGKVVTLVGEFFLSDSDAKEVLKTIKKKLGCGGTFKDGFMEFQGELKDKLRPLLIESSFKFKTGH